MPFVARDNRRIHYVVEGQGPTILLVPGLGSGARLFGTLPRRFARSGFTCAAIDPVGFEPSGPLPSPSFDFDAAADDVLAVLAQLPRPALLAGTSLGGKVALRAAVRAAEPPARLVLLCSSARVTARAQRVYRMFEQLCTAAPPELLGPVLAPFLFGSTFLAERPAVVDDILRSMNPTPASRTFMCLQARALQDFDGEPDAQQCPVPTLCLAGAEDTLTPATEVEATAQLMRRAQFEVIARAGHSLLLESAAAFDAIVRFAQSET